MKAFTITNDRDPNQGLDGISFIEVVFSDGRENACFGPGDTFFTETDLQVLLNAPEKIWHAPIPLIEAYLLPNLDETRYPEYETEREEIISKLPSSVTPLYWGVFEFDDDGTVDNGAWEYPCLPESATAAEYAAAITEIMACFRAIADFNQKVITRCGADAARFEDSWCIRFQLLLYTEDGELLSVVATSQDEPTFTGDLYVTYHSLD